MPRRLTLLLTAALLVAETPRFRAVSIRPARANGEATSISAGLTGKVTIRHATLRDLIVWAYDTSGYRIAATSPLAADHYDIDAKTPVGISAARYRELLQSLLADHFHLRVHRDRKTTPAYALAIDEQGLKLRATRGSRGKFHTAHASLSGENVSMQELATRLSALVNRPVLDNSGLTGTYTFNLTWSQQELKQRRPAPEPAEALNNFRAALKTQLGLKLSEQESPVEMLIVDHAEAPALTTSSE